MLHKSVIFDIHCWYKSVIITLFFIWDRNINLDLKTCMAKFIVGKFHQCILYMYWNVIFQILPEYIVYWNVIFQAPSFHVRILCSRWRRPPQCQRFSMSISFVKVPLDCCFSPCTGPAQYQHLMFSRKYTCMLFTPDRKFSKIPFSSLVSIHVCCSHLKGSSLRFPSLLS